MADIESVPSHYPEASEEAANHCKSVIEEVIADNLKPKLDHKEGDIPIDSRGENLTNTNIPTFEVLENVISDPTKDCINGVVTVLTPVTNDEGFEVLHPIEDKSLAEEKGEVMRSSLAIFLKTKVPLQVMSLIYWYEVQRTTGVFGGILLMFISLQFYPLIVVMTTFALSMLVVAFLYRIGMTIVKAVQKTSAEHPFKHLLEEKIEISEEDMQIWASRLRCYINNTIKLTQWLFLVKDTFSSLKAMLICWLLSYFANIVNILTLCIFSTIVVFTLPKLYEEKPNEVDQVIDVIKQKWCFAWKFIEQRIPEKGKIYFNKREKND